MRMPLPIFRVESQRERGYVVEVLIDQSPTGATSVFTHLEAFVICVEGCF